MRDFGFSAKAISVNAAQIEVHAAFKEVVNRRDEKDPRTRRWLDAIAEFRKVYSRVYPKGLQLVDQGLLPPSEVDTSGILDFLEADPIFDRSGYMKEVLLGSLKKRNLDHHEAERLRAIVIHVVRQWDRREFRRYCRAATSVDNLGFRSQLESLALATDPDIRRRASWVLEALVNANGQI